jgi:para-nitrobenzyl esterase
VLALKWVRENISEFGGDPNTVMIFGESGGGAKCATLMAMPAARGLFHRVATQSGQQITASRRETGTKAAQAVLKALDLTPERAGELRTLPMEHLIVASRAALLRSVRTARAAARPVRSTRRRSRPTSRCCSAQS